MKVKFFLSKSGRSPIEEFLDDLMQDLKSEFFDAVILLEQGQSVDAIEKEIDLVLKRIKEI